MVLGHARLYEEVRVGPDASRGQDDGFGVNFDDVARAVLGIQSRNGAGIYLKTCCCGAEAEFRAVLLGCGLHRLDIARYGRVVVEPVHGVVETGAVVVDNAVELHAVALQPVDILGGIMHHVVPKCAIGHPLGLFKFGADDVYFVNLDAQVFLQLRAHGEDAFGARAVSARCTAFLKNENLAAVL